SVSLSAVDGVSNKLDAINKRLQAMETQARRMAAPFLRVQASFAKFTQLSGIDAIARGFGNVARRAFSAFQSIARIVEPVGAIASAASAAGLYRLAQAWANMGTQLGFSATQIGVTAEQLQTWENASRLAGVGAGTMTQSLVNLKNILSDT